MHGVGTTCVNLERYPPPLSGNEATEFNEAFFNRNPGVRLATWKNKFESAPLNASPIDDHFRNSCAEMRNTADCQ